MTSIMSNMTYFEYQHQGQIQKFRKNVGPNAEYIIDERSASMHWLQIYKRDLTERPP